MLPGDDYEEGIGQAIAEAGCFGTIILRQRPTRNPL